MLDKQDFAFTEDEAAAFIRRYGLRKLGPDQVDAMRQAMERMALAGMAVPRVPSKFDPPAHVFKAPSAR